MSKGDEFYVVHHCDVASVVKQFYFLSQVQAEDFIDQWEKAQQILFENSKPWYFKEHIVGREFDESKVLFIPKENVEILDYIATAYGLVKDYDGLYDRIMSGGVEMEKCRFFPDKRN